MKELKNFIGILLLVLYSFSIKAQSNVIEKYKGNWEFKTTESKLTFKIGNMFIFNVKGEMSVKSGFLKNDDQLKIEVLINASSINTGINKRDDHLKSEDFFYTEKYPLIEFSSSRVEMNKTDEEYAFQTKGMLKIRGIEKEELVLFNIEQVSKSEILITGKAKINRLDYDVDYQMAGMDDNATVKLEVKAILQK